MAGSTKVRIAKYFGGATILQLILDLNEAKGHLEYFFTQDGSKNVIVSVDGKTIKSYDELLALITLDRYQQSSLVDIGLFLSNDGQNSIWPK
jgi:hypothetical protein